MANKEIKLTKPQLEVMKIMVTHPVNGYGYMNQIKALMRRGLVVNNSNVWRGYRYELTEAGAEYMGYLYAEVAINYAESDLQYFPRSRYCDSPFDKTFPNDWRLIERKRKHENDIERDAIAIARYMERAENLARLEIKSGLI